MKFEGITPEMSITSTIPALEMSAMNMVGNSSERPATDFDAIWDSLVGREKSLHDRKKNDYTGDRDPLYNYATAAKIMGVSTEVAMLGRLMEKLTRLQVLLTDGKQSRVVDESIEDTCLDISVIAKLIAVEHTRRSK